MQKLQATTTASSLTSCPLNDQPTGGAATLPPPLPPPPSTAVHRPPPDAAIQCRSRSSRCSKDLESKNQVRSWMGVGRKEGTRRKGRTIAAPTAVAKPASARLRRRRAAGGELRLARLFLGCCDRAAAPNQWLSQKSLTAKNGAFVIFFAVYTICSTNPFSSIRSS